MPPGRARLLMVKEYAKLLLKIRNEFSQDHIISVGDYNMPSIGWVFDDIDSGYLTNTGSNLTNYETKFVQVCAAYGLFQTNQYHNSEGKFLDLIFLSNISNTQVVVPEHYQLIDQNSTHHNAVAIHVISTQEIVIEEKIQKFFNLKLIESKRDLEATIFSLVHQTDIDKFFFDGTTLDSKLDGVTSVLLNIQKRNTSERNLSLPQNVFTGKR